MIRLRLIEAALSEKDELDAKELGFDSMTKIAGGKYRAKKGDQSFIYDPQTKKVKPIHSSSSSAPAKVASPAPVAKSEPAKAPEKASEKEKESEKPTAKSEPAKKEKPKAAAPKKDEPKKSEPKNDKEPESQKFDAPSNVPSLASLAKGEEPPVSIQAQPQGDPFNEPVFKTPEKPYKKASPETQKMLRRHDKRQAQAQMSLARALKDVDPERLHKIDKVKQGVAQRYEPKSGGKFEPPAGDIPSLSAIAKQEPQGLPPLPKIVPQDRTSDPFAPQPQFNMPEPKQEPQSWWSKLASRNAPPPGALSKLAQQMVGKRASVVSPNDVKQASQRQLSVGQKVDVGYLKGLDVSAVQNDGSVGKIYHLSHPAGHHFMMVPNKGLYKIDPKQLEK